MTGCCWKCFEDDYLRSIIKTEGEVGRCALCGNERRKTLDVARLRELFEPIVHLYTDIVEFMPIEMMKEGAGTHATLADKLIHDWEIFADYEGAHSFLDECTSDLSPKEALVDSSFDPDRPVDEEDHYYLDDYAKTIELRGMWGALKKEIQTANRFFAGTKSVERLQDAFTKAAVLLSAKTLFRARVSSKAGFSRGKMGPPPSDLATGGRANPMGIPYLYLASDAITAASEVRPHVGDWVSVATFRPSKRLNVVDLRNPTLGSPFRYGARLADVLAAQGLLKTLGHDLSRPIGSRNADIDYLPTQYLCELIKSSGHDGVAYESGVGEGYNVALFDQRLARCASVEVRRVAAVRVEFEASTP